MNIKTKIAAGVAALAMALGTSACSSDSEVASDNLSTAADNFQVERRVVFFNGITDTYLLSITGRCSIKDEKNQLEVTCKIGKDSFKKHYLGLSDNVSYFVEQLRVVKVDVYHYDVVFKPQVIIPDINVKTD